MGFVANILDNIQLEFKLGTIDELPFRMILGGVRKVKQESRLLGQF